eukprot:2115534-Rhodomonas_salina.1
MRHFLGAQTLGPAVVSALVAKGLRSTRDVLKLDASKVCARPGSLRVSVHLLEMLFCFVLGGVCLLDCVEGV